MAAPINLTSVHEADDIDTPQRATDNVIGHATRQRPPVTLEGLEQRLRAHNQLVAWMNAELPRVTGAAPFEVAARRLAEKPRNQLTQGPADELIVGQGIVDLNLSPNPELQLVANKIVTALTGSEEVAERLLEPHQVARTIAPPEGAGEPGELQIHGDCIPWVMLPDDTLRTQMTDHLVGSVFAEWRSHRDSAEAPELALARFLKAHPDSQEPSFERALVSVMSFDGDRNRGHRSVRLREPAFQELLTHGNPGLPGLPPDVVRRAQERAIAIVDARVVA